MADEPRLSHLDESGAARMVDVSDKAETAREAIAEGYVAMEPETLAMILEGRVPKGDVVAVARIAGIMAAKQTSSLIPLCHPLPITGVTVDIEPVGGRVRIAATVKTTGKTGVEMEALTAVSVTALTVYDALRLGDGHARAVMLETARILGAGLASLVNLFNPDVIVVVGGVARAGESLFAPLRDEVRRRAFAAAALTLFEESLP